MATHRHTQADLNEIAQNRAHAFQRETLVKMLDMGWNVQMVKTEGKATVITVSHNNNGFGLIAPNGMFQRPFKGQTRVTWNWGKMRDLAEATVPFFNVPAK